MSRRKSHLDGDTEFVLAILVGGTVYAHKTAIDRTLHYLVLLGISLAASLFVFMVIRYIRRLRSREINNHISLDDIDKMTGLEFEHFVADLLRKNGYTNVRLTEKYDYGVDIIAVKDGITWGVQAKRYSGLVKASAVRQVVTGLKIYNCDRAMLITNSTFSKVAIKLAKSNESTLVDRTYLLSLI